MLHGLETGVQTVAVIPPAAGEPSSAECRARAQTYRLLSGAFLQEPDAEFLRALRADDTAGALGEAGVRFDADFTAPAPNKLVDTLACEYTSLFVATGGFPPVESVRLSGRYQQEPCFAARQFYAEAGFALGDTRFRLFEDSLGVELAFAAELLDRAAAALDDGRNADFKGLDRDLKRFWTQHLGKWVRGYARLIERATEHSFYREMARLLHDFAESEIALMRLRIFDEDHGRAVTPKRDVKVELNPDEPVCDACGGNR